MRVILQENAGTGTTGRKVNPDPHSNFFDSSRSYFLYNLLQKLPKKSQLHNSTYWLEIKTYRYTKYESLKNYFKNITGSMSVQKINFKLSFGRPRFLLDPGVESAEAPKSSLDMGKIL